MPAVPSWIIEPIWDQFQALIPPIADTHPLGCHNPRIRDRIVFDKLVQVLVFGAAYAKIADSTCSATTIRTRRDEWITAGVFDQLEQLCLTAYDRVVGLDLENVTVDGCLVKAPCGGEAAGKSPVERGKLGTKRSAMTDASGIPIGCVIAPANRNDSPLLRPTLERLGRFDQGMGVGLPDRITVHLDAGYDSAKTRDLLDELGCTGVISQKGFPLQAGARWVVERTHSWHTRGFKKLQTCTERRTRVIAAFIALANAIIIIRRLIRIAWTTHRWDTRPSKRP
ncbi:transposase [Intrasporangium chromatireducens Q5-1]|uniref:Transposase n=1 Tax=Intrasporangium chromatireducens Q5-1 TaxID=584657 RepID=W9GR59_9MICO|nr:IS5 family transposase [Intrasporangium chromatireducens]EWT07323.1 transposase [Intrasporangium chromatireducens Q5-1]